MSQQPNALWLADALDELDAQFSRTGLCSDAAAKLRRLHAENEALKAKFTPLTPGQCVDIADFAAKLEFSDNFLSDICKIVELVEANHGIVKP